MDKRTAQITLEFLKRTDLKGQEVPAFVQAVEALNEVLKATPEDPEETE